ncbi:hypothetical protein D3C76_1447400 [compost metagenome]
MRGLTTSKPNRASATRKIGKIRKKDKAAGSAVSPGNSRHASVDVWACCPKSSPTRRCRALMTITNPSPLTIRICTVRQSAITCRQHARDRLSAANGWIKLSAVPTGTNCSAANSKNAPATVTSTRCKRRCTASSKTPS